MNIVVKIKRPSGANRIAHTIMAYDRGTEELSQELPIPIFLDTLALKVAKVPPEDEFGSLSYELDARSIDTFKFLLGLQADIANSVYFLEPTVGNAPNFGLRKLQAVELMTQVTPRPRYARADLRISEGELVLPTLRLLDSNNRGWVATSNLIKRLTELFGPSGQDAEILSRRRDTYFSQKVRNMISHRDQRSSFIYRGLAIYEQYGLRISELGRKTVNDLIS